LNIAFLAVTRTTQALDSSGTAAAAHAITIQLWQLGGIFLLALSTVAAIIVPSEAAKALKENRSDGLSSAKFAADRLLTWGAVLGVALAGVQLLCLPLLGVFSPLPEVQQAARLPSVIGAALQVNAHRGTTTSTTQLPFACGLSVCLFCKMLLTTANGEVLLHSTA